MFYILIIDDYLKILIDEDVKDLVAIILVNILNLQRKNCILN